MVDAPVIALPPQEFWLLRHGYGVHNFYKDVHGRHPATPDPDLHDIGRRQSETVGQYIKKNGIQINHVICSPMKRTLQTAVEFLKVINFQGVVTVEPLLSEKMEVDCIVNIGSLRQTLELEYQKREGISFDFSRVKEGPWWPSQPETKADVEIRIQAFKDTYFHRLNLPAKQTIICTHGWWIEELTGMKEYPNAALSRFDLVSNQINIAFVPDPAPWRKHDDFLP